MAKSISATNQNRGATIRISVIATARCTRQCAKSGSAHPVLWSLPIAIHAVCRTKSAMTCLTVSSSIHPISAATGTDDDMGGNDKAGALAGTDLEWHGQNGKRPAQLLLKPRTNRPVSTFYDTSRTGMHLQGTQTVSYTHLR